jgi:predicted ester cyclase
MLNCRTVLAAAALAAPASFAPLGGPVLAGANACATDQSAANAALLERYAAAVNGNDAALLREVFAEPYLQHGGIKGLRNVFPDLHLTVEDRIFGGDKIVARNTWTGTHRGAFLGIEPTGKQVTINTIDIWRVERGKLAEHWDVIDIAGLEKQLHGG